MLNDLIGGKIDTSIFDGNYKNDKTGAKAIPPASLIKLIIYGYSKGQKSSRRIGELGEHNIIAKALSGGIEPHWTTISSFISNNHANFQEVFIKVLAYCSELGLIGGQTFAIDGCRLPSNASKALTGTSEELEKRLKIYRRMAEKHVSKHQKKDMLGEVDERAERNYQRQQKKINQKIEKISDFLEHMERKEGKRGRESRSNVTDNESALIMSPSGYIQGYIGIAVSDKENQIIVNAEAVGSSGEGKHLPEVLDKTLENLQEVAVKMPQNTNPVLLADANYYSEENLRACQERGIEAIMPDIQYRKRLGEKSAMRYEASDFKYSTEGNYYECPNGKKLWYKGDYSLFRGHEGKAYQAKVADCRSCPLIAKCIRSKKEPNKISTGRKLLISKSSEPGSLCNNMKEKMNTEEYQNHYASRIQIIEPVFANISYSKGLNRFTLRGQLKVNGQWQLYCMVHNLGKCLKGYNRKYGYA
jgi:transposase